ncbi:MAG: serine hydrolase [Gammaproteobacteria bacterium]|nr:serine hydrolase [Gammaproteobacteria bacterium]
MRFGGGRERLMYSLQRFQASALVAIAVGLVSLSLNADEASTYAPLDTPASLHLEGTIKVIGTDLELDEVHRETWLPSAGTTLPVMEFDVIAVDRSVVPRPRSLQISTHLLFDYIVSPGKSWSDGDENWASLPFTLIHRWVNCTHNGILKFRYDDSQIDHASIRIDQETCLFYKFDMSGEVQIDFALREVDDKEQLREEFLIETEGRLPTATFDDFTAMYEVDAEDFLGGLPLDDDLSVAGIFYEGVHYRTECRTRSEPYPYCDHMLLTSFSTAKSVYPPLALMHLSLNRQPPVNDEKVIDYLPETSDSPGSWDNVTFDHLVDMASGNFDVDLQEFDPAPGNFYGLIDAAEKLEAALSWENGAEAGTRFVYQTSDTYILATALDRFLRINGYGYSDSFAFVVDRIYRPLGLSPAVLGTHRTYEADQPNTGRAYGGYGLWWDTDSIVKLARFMLLDDGTVNDEQLVDPTLLNATLQRLDSDRGIDTPILGMRYNNGMWAIPAHELVEDLEDCETWVPNMSGLSGIRVFLMPNGMIVYYFNDVQLFPSRQAISSSNQVRSLCDDLE